MKVGMLNSLAEAGSDGLPSVAADALQVEMFRAAMSTPASPLGDAGMGDDASGEGDAMGMGALLQHIAGGVRNHLAGISGNWGQAQALASDLEQRPVLDGQAVRDALKLARTASRLSVDIDVASKVGGKFSHTADVMSRG
ncbi:HPt domain-containing protein [Bordetella sputigena]